jgi:methylenetetrahydrofolate reductase (NADPH)
VKSGSNLEKLLCAGEFVVCGEMGPPQSADVSSIAKKCAYFKGSVDAVNLTDNQTAIVRMSSMVSSYFALQGGCEPIMQITCRDRNRLAMQSDILGAFSLGIKNILCLTGDHIKFGNHPEAKGCFDLDSVQLIQMAKKMRDEKQFLSGDEIKQEPRIFIGGAANPFEKWMDAVRNEGLDKEVFILAGVMPVRSVKALLHMKDSVPGMRISPDYIKRMEPITEKDAAMEEGVKIAVEIMTQLRQISGVSGLHIMPVMWESITPRLVQEAGLLPRPQIPSDEPVVMDVEAVR